MIRILAAAALLTAAPATAQDAAPAPRTSPLGGLAGLGGLLGGGVPGVGSAGIGNAAGLLGYCLKNNLLGAAAAPVTQGAAAGSPAAPAAGAGSILQALTGRQGVTTSPAYAAGQSGILQTGQGGGLPLANLKGQVKQQVCQLILRRASSFLGGPR